MVLVARFLFPSIVTSVCKSFEIGFGRRLLKFVQKISNKEVLLVWMIQGTAK